MKLSIWETNSFTLLNDAPLSDLPARMENQISIWLSQAGGVSGGVVEVGVRVPLQPHVPLRLVRAQPWRGHASSALRERNFLRPDRLPGTRNNSTTRRRPEASTQYAVRPHVRSRAAGPPACDMPAPRVHKNRRGSPMPCRSAPAARRVVRRWRWHK
jgi:hypothetical protein